MASRSQARTEGPAQVSAQTKCVLHLPPQILRGSATAWGQWDAVLQTQPDRCHLEVSTARIRRASRD